MMRLFKSGMFNTLKILINRGFDFRKYYDTQLRFCHGWLSVIVRMLKLNKYTDMYEYLTSFGILYLSHYGKHHLHNAEYGLSNLFVDYDIGENEIPLYIINILIDLNIIDKDKFIEYLDDDKCTGSDDTSIGIDNVVVAHLEPDIPYMICKLFDNKDVYKKVCNQGLFNIAKYLYDKGYRIDD
jgi:hypothetical protein